MSPLFTKTHMEKYNDVEAAELHQAQIAQAADKQRAQHVHGRRDHSAVLAVHGHEGWNKRPNRHPRGRAHVCESNEQACTIVWMHGRMHACSEQEHAPGMSLPFFHTACPLLICPDDNKPHLNNHGRVRVLISIHISMLQHFRVSPPSQTSVYLPNLLCPLFHRHLPKIMHA